MKKVRPSPTTVHMLAEVARATKVQDAAHLAVFHRRKNERSRRYDKFLAELKREGSI